MPIKVTENVSWVGKVDWELRTFHGEEYSTHKGSTYNAYLVKDEKTVLIDTVWGPFAKEFVANLAKEIDLKQIDYIIMNHGEPDHSGALPELLRVIPGTPIYCTANAVKSLRGQYHEDWNFQVVKTGDKLNLGSREITFVEAPMLHWPDSMFCYLSGDNILFSNDAFGQHYATEFLFNDLVDQNELYVEAIKYYANILTPFSKLVDKKIKDVLALNLPVAMICPSHGVIWRENPLQIVTQYQQWAGNYQENQVTILYDTYLRNFGLNLGCAFQITDDILDLTGQKKELGKPTGLDLAQGTLTLPMLNLLRSPKYGSWFKNVLEGKQANSEIITELKRVIVESGALQYAVEKAASFATAAIASLNNIPANESKEKLSNLALKVVERTY
jgi:glyoxylase-like metal-dependent hydrolase (beta-lactamase superfamily II)